MIDLLLYIFVCSSIHFLWNLKMLFFNFTSPDSATAVNTQDTAEKNNIFVNRLLSIFHVSCLSALLRQYVWKKAIFSMNCWKLKKFFIFINFRKICSLVLTMNNQNPQMKPIVNSLAEEFWNAWLHAVCIDNIVDMLESLCTFNFSLSKYCTGGGKLLLLHIRIHFAFSPSLLMLARSRASHKNNQQKFFKLHFLPQHLQLNVLFVRAAFSRPLFCVWKLQLNYGSKKITDSVIRLCQPQSS